MPGAMGIMVLLTRPSGSLSYQCLVKVHIQQCAQLHKVQGQESPGWLMRWQNWFLPSHATSNQKHLMKLVGTLSVEVTAGGGKELRDKRPPLQVYIPRQCEKILPNEEIYQIEKDYIIVI